MHADHFDVIVVGAGIAGLSFACEASRSGQRVLVVEKESTPGGLARSFSYGPYTFDVGPHRFHSDDPEVSAFILGILGDDHLIIDRSSAVWMEGMFLEWPLRLSSLLKLDARTLLGAALHLFRPAGEDGPNFEEYIVRQYGRKLYDIFFKPYTRKFLGLDPAQISRDWAITGIDRAVIDKNIGSNSLIGILKSLFSAQLPLKFIYPASGGIGVFAERLVGEIKAAGGEVLLGQSVDRMVLADDQVRGVWLGDSFVACDRQVWTAPLPDFLRLCGRAEPRFDYLSVILYNYALKGKPLIDWQWCYFGAESVPFNRISLPTRFNPALAPPGHSSLCVEVSCRTGDAAWNGCLDAEPKIRASLVELGIVDCADSLTSVWIEKVPYAYPVYDLQYRQRRSAAQSTGLSNAHLLGRTGEFWYNNMDHSIAAALALFRKLGAEAGNSAANEKKVP